MIGKMLTVLLALVAAARAVVHGAPGVSGSRWRRRRRRRTRPRRSLPPPRTGKRPVGTRWSRTSPTGRMTTGREVRGAGRGPSEQFRALGQVRPAGAASGGSQGGRGGRGGKVSVVDKEANEETVLKVSAWQNRLILGGWCVPPSHSFSCGLTHFLAAPESSSEATLLLCLPPRSLPHLPRVSPPLLLRPLPGSETPRLTSYGSTPL